MSRLRADEVIASDLRALRCDRRRHFAPAVVLSLSLLGLGFMSIGLRADLWDQPLGELVLQTVLWVLGLVVFPSIGAGLWFPKRPVRAGILALAAIAVMVSSLGIFADPSSRHPAFLGCSLVVMAGGGGLLAAAAVSGAFVQRCQRGSALWVSTGLSIAALNTITWVCPEVRSAHVVFHHLGAAVLLGVLSASVGLIAHRRRWRSGPSASTG